MYYLYEYNDILNTPFEAFICDTSKHGFPIKPHFHHYLEMIYMLEGNIILETDTTEYHLEEGDMFFIFSNQIHSMYSCSKTRARYAVVKYNASKLNVPTTFTPSIQSILNLAKSENARVHFHRSDPGMDAARIFFLKCIEEMDQKNIGYDINMHALLCLNMTNIIRIWQSEGINIDNAYKHITAKDYTIQNILEYMEANLGNNLKVADLAKICNMSYSHFARCFKDLYGRSCKEYLEILKIETADEMLRSTDLSINDISSELGYADASHFIRTFKKYKNTTPRKVSQ